MSAEKADKKPIESEALVETSDYRPSNGFLSNLPASWIPYAQLMRLDRPAGFYAFYFPYLIGIMYAACIADTLPEPAILLRLALLLLPFNVLLRGLACTFNDNVDQEFDRQVERCRSRPIARGAVSTIQAHLFTVAQALVGAPLLAILPRQCSIHAALMAVTFCLYALAKRITYYPQVVLGFPFAWAIVFCVIALDMDPFGSHLTSTAALFAANVLWTVVYDTIYAHQDINDDTKAGVKSMALAFRHTTKLLSTSLALAQGILLIICGRYADFSVAYYVGTVGGVVTAMSYYIYAVDLKSPKSCGLWFHTQFWTVGAGFLAGLVGEYIVRRQA